MARIGAGLAAPGAGHDHAPGPGAAVPPRPAVGPPLRSGEPRRRRPRRARGRPSGRPGVSPPPAAASPSSGSRKGRFRWTGPGPGRPRRWPRPPTGRPATATTPGWRRRARPGSANQRTARPKGGVWSMVWGAPTSRSSGGRSAVQTMSGTRARSASTTAACSSAAAVPLVVSTTAGTAGGQPDPEGGEPGRALVEPDVDRHRGLAGQGQGQRRRAGSRAHHGVGHPAAHPLVDQGGGEGGLGVGIAGSPDRSVRSPRAPMPPCRPPHRPGHRRRSRRCTPGRRRGAASGAGPRLHPDRAGVGLDRRATWPPTTRWWRWTCPATAARPRCASTLVDGAGCCWPEVGGRADYLGLLDGSAVLPPPGPGPPRPGRLAGADLGHRRHRRPRRAPARRRSDEALADRLDPTGAAARRPCPVEAFLRQWMANPMFAGITAEAGGLEERRRNTGRRPGLEPPAGRDRHPAAAVGPARPDSRCRSWSSPASATRSSPPSDGGWSRPSGRTPPWSVVPGAGHAPHLAATRRGGRLGPASTWTGRADPAEPDADRHGIPSDGQRHPQPQGADNSTPKASCSRPVAASTGSRARPSASPETIRTGATASGRRQQGQERDGRVPPGDGAGHGQQGPHQHPGEREPDAGRRSTTRPGRGPTRTASVRLPAARVGGDVPQVVGQQQRGGQQAHRHGGEPHDRHGRAGGSGRRRCRRWPPARRTRRRTARPTRRSRRDGARRCRTSRRPGRPRRPSRIHHDGGPGQGQPDHPGDAEGQPAPPAGPPPAGPVRTPPVGPDRPGRRRSPGSRRSSRWRSWSRPGWPGPPPARPGPATTQSIPDGGRRDRARPWPTTAPGRADGRRPCPTSTGTTAAGRVRGRAPSTHRLTGPGATG